MLQIWSDIVSFAVCSQLQFVRIRVHLHFSIDVEKTNARTILHPTYDDDGTGVPSTHAEKRKRDELKELDELHTVECSKLDEAILAKKYELAAGIEKAL